MTLESSERKCSSLDEIEFLDQINGYADFKQTSLYLRSGTNANACAHTFAFANFLL